MPAKDLAPANGCKILSLSIHLRNNVFGPTDQLINIGASQYLLMIS